MTAHNSTQLHDCTQHYTATWLHTTVHSHMTAHSSTQLHDCTQQLSNAWISAQDYLSIYLFV